MNAKLSCSGNSIEIADFYHSKQDENNGNPYNCTFNIYIKSGSFSGCADGCDYDYKEWKKFVNHLKNVVLNKAEQAVLHEIGYGSKIVFTGDGIGHIQVSGIIFGQGKIHTLQFEFFTDQTFFADFIRELECL